MKFADVFGWLVDFSVLFSTHSLRYDDDDVKNNGVATSNYFIPFKNSIAFGYIDPQSCRKFDSNRSTQGRTKQPT